MEKPVPFQERKKMTRLGGAIVARLGKLGKPLISNYDLFGLVWGVYKDGSTKYLRGDRPTKEVFTRIKAILRDEDVIQQDDDYPRHWRVLTQADLPADDVVCLADDHCYISHLSAMQRYGLTNRRPEALHITILKASEAKRLNAEKRQSDYGDATPDIFLEQFQLTHHPSKVRGRDLSTLETASYGSWRHLRGTYARIASIGQVFLDTIQEPEKCGGMRHILDVWQEHAKIYLDEIIEAVENRGKNIHKVRAGFILDEMMHVADPRVLAWQKFAQRGGSQVLQPGSPYAAPFSEKWMLSINV